MVTAEHDNSVLVQATLLQGVEKLANAVINVADGTVVSPPGAFNLVIGEVLIPYIGHLHEALAVGVLLVFGDLDLGQINVYAFVQIPVLLLDGVGVVRVSERDLWLLC